MLFIPIYFFFFLVCFNSSSSHTFDIFFIFFSVQVVFLSRFPACLPFSRCLPSPFFVFRLSSRLLPPIDLSLLSSSIDFAVTPFTPLFSLHPSFFHHTSPVPTLLCFLFCFPSPCLISSSPSSIASSLPSSSISSLLRCLLKI